jgi:hypothetical protein
MAPSVKSSPVYINTSVSHADSRTIGSNVLLPQELTNLSTTILLKKPKPINNSQKSDTSKRMLGYKTSLALGLGLDSN